MKTFKGLLKFIKKDSLVTPSNYWLEVSECPLKSWRRCSDIGYSALRIDPKVGTVESDTEAYDILYQDFVKQIGQGLDFENYLSNIAAYILAGHKFMKSRIMFQGVETHNRKLLIQINILKAKIDKFEKTGDEKVTTIQKVLNRLSKMQGHAVLEKDHTVLSYFELIKDFKQWQK